LKYPQGLAVGPDGSLYIADYFNRRIRRVGPDGIITTVAGNGAIGSGGDGGLATQAQFWNPQNVAVGPDGSLYIADSSNNRIRRVGADGIITTVAGDGINGFSGDGGPAAQAQLDGPFGVAVGPDGSLYIADLDNNRIRRVRPDGIMTTVAGNGSYGFSGDGGPATQAQLNFPTGVAVGPDGRLYIADLYNSRIRRVDLPLAGFSLDDITVPSEDAGEVYLFDRHGRHLHTLNAFTGAVRYQFGYDSAGRLATVTDGDGNVTAIEHNASGNPTAIIAPFGQRTMLSPDANGYLANLKNPAGEIVRFTYSADGLLISMADPNGNQYRFSHDTVGRLIRDEDPAGGSKGLVRTELPNGFEATLTTALGRTTKYQVEELPTGDKRRVNISPNGLQEERGIGTNGSRTTTLPDGTVQSLILGPDPRFGMQSPLPTQIQVRTPSGLVSTLMESRTVTLSDPLDPLTLLTQTDILTLNHRTYTNLFDATLRKMTSRTPEGRQNITWLDAKGRVVMAQLPGFDPLQFTYDPHGHLSGIAQGTRTSLLSYDAQGNLAGITDPLSRFTGFEYDPAGRLTRQVLPDGRAIRYSYDANGNLTSITPPGRPSHAFTYTVVDLEEDYTPPDIGLGTPLTHYAYNLDRQLVQVTRPDGSTFNLGYDSAGRLTTLMLPRGQVSIGYHPSTGNLATLTAPDGGVLAYEYDGSLLTNETWSGAISASVQRTYDNNFRLISQGVNGGSSVSFQYDPDGLLTQAGALTLSRDPRHGLITGTTLGNIADAWTYNSFGEPASYRATFSGNNVFATQYIRDPLGRITQITETLEGQTATYTYGYDLAGRLTEVTRDGSTVATYLYDSNRNRLSATDGYGTATGSYDIQDRLTQYGSTIYTYTANGELQGKTAGSQTTTYTYDAVGNLTAVTLLNGTQIEYVIDGRNRRVGKKVNGTLVQGWLYAGPLAPVAELDGSGNIAARFIYGTHANVPDYMIKGGYTYRLITDHLGSPRLVIDTTTGHIVQRLAYDAFGRVLFDDNPGFQPFGFAGGLYDPDTKLTRFGARDYDAETGRWTAKDPILFNGGDTNLYGYVLNDPVNWVDLWGLEFISAEEGQQIVDVAKSWVGTAYVFGGKSKGGADCSGSTWAIYREAGFPYKYLPSASFPNSPSFRPSPDNVPQVGDIGRWNGHMVIYDPNAPNGNNVWTAHRTGGPPYGVDQFEKYNKIYGAVTWHRYYKPD
jgi:RHS repeat-associated protein